MTDENAKKEEETTENLADKSTSSVDEKVTSKEKDQA